MLNRITHYGVVVESESQEFPRELTLLDLLGERRIVDSGSWAWVVRQLGLHDLLLDQLIEGMEIRRPIVLRVTLRLFWRVAT